MTGLGREASIAAGPGVVATAGGGSRDALERRLAASDPRPLAAVVSFGIAGALDRSLRVGDLVVPEAIRTETGARFAVDGSILAEWRSRLRRQAFRLADGELVGVDAPLLDPGAKAALRGTTGAAAVDMESHVAAAWAARHGLPFAVLRVISDGAETALPPVAGRAMRPDGSVALGRVLGGLARDPGQVPVLLRTARDAALAFRALRRVRGLLGPRLGLHL